MPQWDLVRPKPSRFCRLIFNKQSAQPTFPPCQALTSPPGPFQFCLPIFPGTTQIPSSWKPVGALWMLLIPGLPLSPEGPRRGHLFSFYLLYWCHMASLDCLQVAGFVFFPSLMHSLVSVLVLLLCFSSPGLECGGGQQEDTGQVVLLPLLAYEVWK